MIETHWKANMNNQKVSGLNNFPSISSHSIAVKTRLMTALAVSVFAFSAFAEVKTFKIGKGRSLTYEISNNPEAPATLVLLPGINRGLQFETEKAFFSSPAFEKYNVLAITSSLHPRSINSLATNEEFYGQSSRVTSKDLALEVEALVAELKVVKPIAVSLSFSSSILAELNPKKFAGFIEMVPMTDPLDGEDSTKKLLRDQQDFMMLNPFFAPSIRYQRDLAYQTFWSNQVDGLLQSNPNQYGSQPRVDDIKAGYVDLAQSSESYRLTRVQMKAVRHFILAANELEDRLKTQVQMAVQENQKSQGKASLVVVADSGHILPSENPVSAAVALDQVAQALLQGRSVTGTVKGSKLTPYTAEQKKEIGLK